MRASRALVATAARASRSLSSLSSLSILGASRALPSSSHLSARAGAGLRAFSTGDAQVLKVPGMGDSITEGALVKWLKKKGDYVALDEIVREPQPQWPHVWQTTLLCLHSDSKASTLTLHHPQCTLTLYSLCLPGAGD